MDTMALFFKEMTKLLEDSLGKLLYIFLPSTCILAAWCFFFTVIMIFVSYFTYDKCDDKFIVLLLTEIGIGIFGILFRDKIK